MTRLELVKRLAEFATYSANDTAQEDHAQASARHGRASAPDAGFGAAAVREVPTPLAAIDAEVDDLFVWFEDTSQRQRDGRRGIAGLPESLLPYGEAGSMRVIDRRYVEGHCHLLSAIRVRCPEHFGERIASIYTAALSVGTIAWIGTGAQYAQAWAEMFADVGHDGSAGLPGFPS